MLATCPAHMLKLKEPSYYKVYSAGNIPTSNVHPGPSTYERISKGYHAIVRAGNPSMSRSSRDLNCLEIMTWKGRLAATSLGCLPKYALLITRQPLTLLLRLSHWRSFQHMGVRSLMHSSCEGYGTRFGLDTSGCSMVFPRNH